MNFRKLTAAVLLCAPLLSMGEGLAASKDSAAVLPTAEPLSMLWQIPDSSFAVDKGGYRDPRIVDEVMDRISVGGPTGCSLAVADAVSVRRRLGERHEICTVDRCDRRY